MRTSDEVYADVMCEGTPNNPRGWMTSVARCMASKILERVKEPVRCLDLGCGVGELCRVLKANGIDCGGVDNNHTFIKKAKERNPEIFFIETDFVRMGVHKKYGLVTATHDVFNMQEDHQKLVSVAAQALGPGGLFVFDLITPLGFQTWQDVQVQERDDFFMLQKCIYNDETGRGTVKLTGFVQSESGYERFDVVTDVFSHDLEDVEQSLYDAGFSNVETYNEWQGLTGDTGCDPMSTKLTVVATKGD